MRFCGVEPKSLCGLYACLKTLRFAKFMHMIAFIELNHVLKNWTSNNFETIWNVYVCVCQKCVNPNPKLIKLLFQLYVDFMLALLLMHVRFGIESLYQFNSAREIECWQNTENGLLLAVVSMLLSLLLLTLGCRRPLLLLLYPYQYGFVFDMIQLLGGNWIFNPYTILMCHIQ